MRETKKERERERAMGREELGGESINAYIGALQPTWVELGSCSALRVKP